jgi:hypothetical protein
MSQRTRTTTALAHLAESLLHAGPRSLRLIPPHQIIHIHVILIVLIPRYPVLPSHSPPHPPKRPRVRLGAELPLPVDHPDAVPVRRGDRGAHRREGGEVGEVLGRASTIGGDEAVEDEDGGEYGKAVGEEQYDW